MGNPQHFLEVVRAPRRGDKHSQHLDPSPVSISSNRTMLTLIRHTSKLIRRTWNFVSASFTTFVYNSLRRAFGGLFRSTLQHCTALLCTVSEWSSQGRRDRPGRASQAPPTCTGLCRANVHETALDTTASQPHIARRSCVLAGRG